MRLKHGAVTALLIVVATAPSWAGWGLHTWKDRMTDKETTVVTSGVPNTLRGYPPPSGATFGIVVKVTCDHDNPVEVSHGMQTFPGKPLSVRGDSHDVLELGEHGGPLSRAQFVTHFLTSKSIRVQFYEWPTEGAQVQQEDLVDFKKQWHKAMKKLGCWKDADWPEVQF